MADNDFGYAYIDNIYNMDGRDSEGQSSHPFTLKVPNAVLLDGKLHSAVEAYPRPNDPELNGSLESCSEGPPEPKFPIPGIQ